MTSRTPLFLLFTLILTALSVACGGGSPPMAADDGDQDGQIPPQLRLVAGYDCWKTESGHVDITLPPDFFGPGSQPFSGRLELVGVPLETAGPFELGDTDMVVRRELDMLLPLPGEQTEVPIQLVALNLQSVEPILTQTLGGPDSWDVSLGLAPKLEGGVLMAVRPDSGAVRADFSLPVQPLLVFTSRSNPALQHQLPLVGGTLLAQDAPFDPDSDNGGTGLDNPFLRLGPDFGFLDFVGPNMGLRVRRALPDAGRPLPMIDAGARVETPIENIGRFVQIEDRVVVEAGTLIGPGSTIGRDTLIGRDVLIAEGVTIGAGCVIGDGAIVGANVQLANGCQVGAGAQIHRLSVVGPNAVLGSGVYVGARCILGANVTLHDQAGLKNGVQVGDQVVVNAGVTIAAEAILPAFVTMEEELLLGQLQDGSTQHGTAGDLEAAGAAIIGDVTFGLIGNIRPVDGEVTGEVPLDPNALPPGLANLQRDVNQATNGAQAPVIKDRKYVKVTYDCDDFAGDMEEALTTKGYTATFTVYYCWDSVFEGEPDAWRYPWEYTPSLLRGHAVTDIHHGGRTIWLEPQTGQLGIKLDFNGDGRTGYATDHGSRALTDGNYRIEVYPDRAAAVRAGVVLD